jgi:NADH:ubiquinone oxidoreductase subunit K
MITLNHFLILGALVFSIGLYGVLAKKNAIAVLMSIELMLNAINLNLVAFAKYTTPGQFAGHVFAIFIIGVAAAEIAIGLALVIAVYRDRVTTNLDDFNWLKW